MKYKLLYVIAILLSSSCESKQENKPDNSQTQKKSVMKEIVENEVEHIKYVEISIDSLNIDSTILSIDEEFKRISSIEKWTNEEIIIIEESTEGGEMKLFVNGDDLEKFSVTLNFETGQQFSEFYLNRGRLIFVYKKESKYNKNIYDEDTPVGKSKVNEIMTYYYSRKVIKQTSDDESNYTKFPEEIIIDYDRYIDIINDSSKVFNRLTEDGKSNMLLK